MENLSMIKAKRCRSLLSVLEIIQKNKVNEGTAGYFYDYYGSSFGQYGNSYKKYLNVIPFETPHEMLVNKIVQQVEYLFSEENLLKDKFLSKHIRRNKEGYVSLKLISSLRKVKALSKDWRVIAYSLQKSQKLQMNEEKTKIKRIDPLPALERKSTKTVLVFYYLPSCWTPENVMKQLKKLGNIITMKTINSSAEVLNISVKRTLEVNANIATFPFKIVKFETPEEAANAILQTSHVSSILKIIPLVKATYEIPKSTFGESSKEDFLKYDESYAHLNKKMAQINFEPLFGSEWMKLSELNLSDQENLCLQSKYADRRRLPNENQCQESAEEKPMLPCSYKGDGPINNPRSRRSCLKNHKQARVIVIRQPRGPDGTIGFQHPRHPFKNVACAIY